MKIICFVQKNPSIRVYMQAKSLKSQKKYKLILVCERCDYFLYRNIFDEIIFYGFLKEKKYNFFFKLCNYIFDTIFHFGEKKLKKIIKGMNVDIFHAHSEPNDIPIIVIENSDKPVVFDAQDFTGISSGLENLDVKTREDEKFCLEYAHGICRKGPDFEIDYYRQNGYKINCPELRWIGCCNEDFFTDLHVKKISGEDGEIHLIYAGSISPDLKFEYKYYIPLAKELARQAIHLHIYPSHPSEYASSQEYVDLSKKEKYFHFHKNVTYSKLSREISKYDWGILITKDVRGKRFIEEKTKVAMATKLFSYIEAGLPMIVDYHLTAIKDFVEENKIGFAVRNDELCRISERIKNSDYRELKENIIKAREAWSFRKQSVYLENFYLNIKNRREDQ